MFAVNFPAFDARPAIPHTDDQVVPRFVTACRKLYGADLEFFDVASRDFAPRSEQLRRDINAVDVKAHTYMHRLKMKHGLSEIRAFLQHVERHGKWSDFAAGLTHGTATRD